MKKRLLGIIICAILFVGVIFSNNQLCTAKADDSYYLGGFATGFNIKIRGAEVVGLSDVLTESGVLSPSKNAGICVHDRLMSIDTTEINCAKDIEKALKNFKGEKVVAIIKRNGESLIKDVYPAKEINGKYKIGLFIRDDLNGIGTMTFVKKNGEFMALGHPICNNNEEICQIVSGSIFGAKIIGVNKGIKGKAGELKGVFSGEQKIGTVTANLDQGIKGKMSADSDLSALKQVQIGNIKMGSAKMVTSIDSADAKEYDISIVKIVDKSKDTKNFVIKVNDEQLLKTAGGIVQGMSGSPILQDGKLVGAVTHVFINDPTRGYGILIDNMLKAK